MRFFRLLSRPFRLTRRMARWGRDAVVWLCLICFAATVSGLPLPDAPHFAGGIPFPCQGHRCGCRSADQCWKQCCCFSHEQKLAWAEQNGVAPPPGVVTTQTKSCCASKLTKQSTSPAKTSSCCSEPKTTRESEWIFAWKAQKCRGVATQWLSLGAVCADFHFVELPQELAPCGQIVLLNEDSLSVVTLPTTPPPERLLAL